MKCIVLYLCAVGMLVKFLPIPRIQSQLSTPFGLPHQYSCKKTISHSFCCKRDPLVISLGRTSQCHCLAINTPPQCSLPPAHMCTSNYAVASISGPRTRFLKTTKHLNNNCAVFCPNAGAKLHEMWSTKLTKKHWWVSQVLILFPGPQGPG